MVKFLRGASSRISTAITAFCDGVFYFTPDDGGFYVDCEHEGEQKRVRINPPSVAVNQGVENAGKVLGIGVDGSVAPVSGSSGARTWGDLAGITN